MRIIFETEHLRVRAFEIADADRLYKNHLDSDMEKWFPNECYEDLDETRGAIGFYVDCVNKNKLPLT